LLYSFQRISGDAGEALFTALEGGKNVDTRGTLESLGIGGYKNENEINDMPGYRYAADSYAIFTGGSGSSWISNCFSIREF